MSLYDCLFLVGIQYREIGTGENEVMRFFKDALTKALVLCRDRRTTERQYIEIFWLIGRDKRWCHLLGEVGTSDEEVGELEYMAELKSAQRTLSYCRLGFSVAPSDLKHIRERNFFDRGELIEYSQEELDGYIRDAFLREAVKLLERARGGDEPALVELLDRLDEEIREHFGRLSPEDVGTSVSELERLKRQYSESVQATMPSP